MNYENLDNEELLKEVYLTQHKDRLLTLVCERLEMEMRVSLDLATNVEEVDRLNDQLADQDEEIYALNRRVEDLETQLDLLTGED